MVLCHARPKRTKQVLASERGPQRQLHDYNFSNKFSVSCDTSQKAVSRRGACDFRVLHPFYIHVQLAVMLSFHVVQHAQIEKCIPRRFCIKQNNQRQILKGVMINVSTAPSQQSLTLPVQ